MKDEIIKHVLHMQIITAVGCLIRLLYKIIVGEDLRNGDALQTFLYPVV